MAVTSQSKIRAYRYVPTSPMRLAPQGLVVLPGSLRRGLVAWWLAQPWLFHGTMLRDLIGTNHGRLTNMGTGGVLSGYGGTLRPGGAGELRFDLTDDYIDCGAATAINLTESLTITAWIFLNTFGGGGLGRILDHRGATSTGYAFQVSSVPLEVPENALNLTINNGTAYGQDTITSQAFSLETGRWTHVAVSLVSASTATLYVNGAVVAQHPGSGALNQAITSAPAVRAQLGAADGRTDRNFDGKMDDIRLWNRPLSTPEIEWVYRSSLVGLSRLYRSPRMYRVVGLISRTLQVLPAQMAGASATPLPRRIIAVQTTKTAWRAPLLQIPRVVRASKLALAASTLALGRVVTALSAKTAWKAATRALTVLSRPAALAMSAGTGTLGRTLQVATSRFAWSAPTRALTLLGRGALVALQTTPSTLGRSIVTNGAQQAWQAATRALTVLARPAVLATMATLGALTRTISVTPSRGALVAPTRALTSLGRPASTAWQAPATTQSRGLSATPGTYAWQAPQPTVGIALQGLPGQWALQAVTLRLPRSLVVTATRSAAQAPSAEATAGTVRLSIPPSQLAWRAASRALTVLARPGTTAWKDVSSVLGIAGSATPARQAWGSATGLLGRETLVSMGQLAWGVTTPRQSSMLLLTGAQGAMRAPVALLARTVGGRATQAAWRTATAFLGRGVLVSMAHVAWQALTPQQPRTLLLTGAQLALQAPSLLLGRGISGRATQMAWRTATSLLGRTVLPQATSTALAAPAPRQTSIARVSPAAYRFSVTIAGLGGGAVSTRTTILPAALAWQVAHAEAALRPTITHRHGPVFLAILAQHGAQLGAIQTHATAQTASIQTWSLATRKHLHTQGTVTQRRITTRAEDVVLASG